MTLKKCIVCTATLKDNKVFEVSYGPDMPLEKMFNKVCRFTDSPGCVHPDKENNGKK